MCILEPLKDVVPFLIRRRLDQEKGENFLRYNVVVHREGSVNAVQTFIEQFKFYSINLQTVLHGLP